ncbi:Metalloprotease MmpA [bacterium HR40]|nr:Metalloprotease MmpA [bacterium HR40]
MLTLVTGYIVPFLLVLTVVVFVHEFGHYLVARRNGVRVEVFSIGFGPELFGWTDRVGTRFKFSLIPLGGYVKMHGDEDVTSLTVAAAASDPQAFPAKSVWQRMAIVAAGPAANFLFASLVLALFFVFIGRPFTPPVVGDVMADSPAAAAGLRPGDRILAVDGAPIESFEQLQQLVRDRPGEPLRLTVERRGERLQLTVTPALREIETRFGTQRIGMIGVVRDGVEYRRSDPLSALLEGVVETVRIAGATLVGVGEMLAGVRGTEELGGPIRIAQMSGEIAREGLLPAIWFTAILSINLGLINLFPIPMLDGGHLLLYTIEALRGRPLTERSLEIAFRVGLALVVGLMLFATWNDLRQLNVVDFFARLLPS